MQSADLGNGLKLSLDWGTDRRLASKRLYTAAGTDIWHVGYSYDTDDNITGNYGDRCNNPQLIHCDAI